MRPSFFNADSVCVTEIERVYVSICVLWRKGNVERCACDRDIERCECANDHACMRHREMPIRCVYMRERSSVLLVCV